MSHITLQTMNRLPDGAKSVLRDINTSHSTSTLQTANEVYEKAKQALHGFRAMVRDYEKMNKHSNGIEFPAWARWKQDCADLEQLNKCILAHAMMLLEDLIIPSREGTHAEPVSRGSDDVQQIAWELLQNNRSRNGENTWGNAAQDLLRAVSGVVNVLQ